MEVNCFQILLIDVTFYLEHVQKVVHNEVIKMICGTGGKRAKGRSVSLTFRRNEPLHVKGRSLMALHM